MLRYGLCTTLLIILTTVSLNPVSGRMETERLSELFLGEPSLYQFDDFRGGDSHSSHNSTPLIRNRTRSSTSRSSRPLSCKCLIHFGVAP